MVYKRIIIVKAIEFDAKLFSVSKANVCFKSMKIEMQK